MSPAQRNSVVLVVATILYYAWWRIANVHALAHPEADDIVDPLILHALLDVALGFALYFAFVASLAVRVMLAASAPLLAGVLLELTVGSDRAYPLSILLMAALIALMFVIGALVASGIHAWRKRRRESVA